MKVNISKEKWMLKGYWPYSAYKERSTETDKEIFGVTDWISATVPGGVHYDLYKNGFIDNPYIGFNSQKCEWVENRWWVYYTCVKVKKNKNARLIFKGLDYNAEIYVNGILLGEHENMYTPAIFDISHILKDSDKIEIKVIFKGIPDEMGQIGYTSMSKEQKSRFNYKWDFATRMVNIGIWDEVYIDYYNEAYLKEASVTTDVNKNGGIIKTEFVFSDKLKDGVNIKILDPDGKEVLSQKLKDSYKKDYVIKNPKLWYPADMGEQPLYTLVLSADEIYEEYQVGIRKLRYEQNPGGDKKALPYTIVINDEKVYAKGVNMVPLDHTYGNVTEEQYEWYIKSAVSCGANIIRVWGGGLIEKEEFYKLCDKYGVMVWQDFIQSSSNLDNLPSKKKRFLEKAKDTVEYAVKTRRNYVSMTVWCGGNELMNAKYAPVGFSDKNIAMIYDIVKKNDGGRAFMPATPSGKKFSHTLNDKTPTHDVHGHWKFLGVKGHYEYYNDLDALLHSEYGAEGASLNIEKFAGEFYKKKLSEINNIWYINRGGEWWDSRERDRELFGEFKDLKEYAVLTQWIQAEAVRYAAENDIRRKPKNSGTIVWQLNEPYPNLICSNMIDYFGTPKMVYYYMKDAYKTEASLRYDGLCVNDEFKAAVSVKEKTGATLKILDKLGVCLYEKDVKDGEEVKVNVSACEDIFAARLICGDTVKEYFFSRKEKEYFKAFANMKKAKLDVKFDKVKRNDNGFTGRVKIKNTGKAPAYFVHLENKACSVISDNGYFTLYSGEEKEISYECTKYPSLFFTSPDNIEKPTVEWLNK